MGIRIKEVNEKEWIIEDANKAIEIKPENGGSIGPGTSNSGPGDKGPFRPVDLALLIVVIAVSIGLLIVVVGDVIAGTISFSIYVTWVLVFLAGLGVGRAGRS
jgi:hypothetical protein